MNERHWLESCSGIFGFALLVHVAGALVVSVRVGIPLSQLAV